MKNVLIFLLTLVTCGTGFAQERPTNVDIIRTGYWQVTTPDTLTRHTDAIQAVEQMLNFTYQGVDADSIDLTPPTYRLDQQWERITVDTVYYDTVDVKELSLRNVEWQQEQDPDSLYIETRFESNADSVEITYLGVPNYTERTIIPDGHVTDHVALASDEVQVHIGAYYKNWLATETFNVKKNTMSQYFTDFSEYTTGQQPSDWTRRYDAGVDEWLVQSDTNAEGGKILNWSGSNGRDLLSWDIVDSDANRDDVEILYKVRFPVATEAQAIGFTRGSGTTSTITGYTHGASPEDGDLRLSEYNGGDFFINNTIAFTFSADTWYWVRVRVNGTDHFGKIWEDGNSEPASWDVTDTDSTTTAAGWVGIFSFWQGAWDMDVFSVGTGGDTAPMTDPDGGATDVSFSLNSATNVSSDSTSQAEAGIALDTGANVSDGSTAAGESDISISHSQQATTQSTAQAEGALSLSNLLQIAFNKQSITEASFSLPTVHQVTTVSDTQIVSEASFSLALQKAITTKQISTIEVSYSLNTIQQVMMASSGTGEASMALNLQASLSLVSTALAEAGISFNAVQSLTLSGQAVGVEVTLADGRTLTIKLQNRTLTIPDDNRIFTIDSENRTYNIDL